MFQSWIFSIFLKYLFYLAGCVENLQRKCFIINNIVIFDVGVFNGWIVKLLESHYDNYHVLMKLIIPTFYLFRNKNFLSLFAYQSCTAGMQNDQTLLKN